VMQRVARVRQRQLMIVWRSGYEFG